jgi:DNA-binding PadR family transcriptional regulator
MSIKYAILGILSYQPQTGYDLKKLFAESAALYWSGNNNQIYRTLVELLDAGRVTNEVHMQEKLPPKKIYSITEKGRLELKNWTQSRPEPPEFRNTFLIQLMWADLLTAAELDTVLAGYEQEVQNQLLMQREQARRGAAPPARTARESVIWNAIAENIAGAYEQELRWVQKLRADLANGEVRA